MAISKSFFGLRRKSTKSLTFSVLNGKQITKDRVSAVKNPKSEAQAMQRMRFALLSVNLAAFRPILERSVESVNYGNESVQYIMKKNMKNWKLQGYRKDSGFQPADMQLSYGSLPSLEWNSTEENQWVTPVQVMSPQGSTVREFREGIGAQIGDQLTIVGAFSTGDPKNPYMAGWDSFYFTEELDAAPLTIDDATMSPAWLSGLDAEHVLFQIGRSDNGEGVIYGNLQNQSIGNLIMCATILSRDGDGKHLRSNAVFNGAAALGTTAALAIIQGRNSFMGISSTLPSDWPTEQTPVSQTVYTLGGVRLNHPAAGSQTQVGTFAVLLKQEIMGNTITTKKIAISESGSLSGLAYESGVNFPLVPTEYAWSDMTASQDDTVPTECVSYDVARALVG